MLIVSEADHAQRAAAAESRGAHSRLDFPGTMDPAFGKVNTCVQRAATTAMHVGPDPLPRCRRELKALFEAPTSAEEAG